jgi:hypothetical protein
MVRIPNASFILNFFDCSLVVGQWTSIRQIDTFGEFARQSLFAQFTSSIVAIYWVQILCYTTFVHVVNQTPNLLISHSSTH